MKRIEDHVLSRRLVKFILGGTARQAGRAAETARARKECAQSGGLQEQTCSHQQPGDILPVRGDSGGVKAALGINW